MADDEISKREFLKGVVVFGGGAAAGYLAREGVDNETGAMLPGGGGDMPVENLDDINLVMFRADEDPEQYEPNQTETWAVHPTHGILHWEADN